MDLPHVSTFWGSQLGKSTSAAEESDEDSMRQSDFSVGYDSEEEQRHEMEELLYCQMYFTTNSMKSVENGEEEESSYHVSDLSNSDLLLKKNKLSAGGEEVKHVKREKNKDCSDVTKSNEKLKKSRMMEGENEYCDEKLVPNKSCANETASSSFINIPDDSFNSSEVVLVPTDSDKSWISSNVEPYLVEDESEQEESNAQKQIRRKCKERIRKMREEVIDVSDSSSDSSLFLDISSDDDDDIAVHMMKSRAAGDQGENDDHLKAILNGLPECDWKISDTDRLGSSCGLKSRYYNSTSKLRCFNCNQRGHFTNTCPEPKKVMACILCGNRGHSSKYCSRSLCFRCNRPGHTAKECDRKRTWSEHACHRCGVQGHYERDCPDNWRQFHFTIISSEIVRGPKLENHRKFCYNCAAVGHFGHECIRRWRGRYVPPATPFIVKYDRNHDRRCQAKQPFLQDEGVTAFVAGKESYLAQHIEAECQREGDKRSDRKWRNQAEGKIFHQSNEMNEVSLDHDRRKEVGKTHFISNSAPFTNFAMKVKEKLLDMKKSAKKRPRKRKTSKDVLQLDYLPLAAHLSGSEGNAYHSFQRPAELLSGNVSSLSKAIVSRTPMDGLYAGDFPRSNVETWTNQDSAKFYRKKEVSRLSDCLADSSGGYYPQSQFTTPNELKAPSNRFISRRKLELQQTSTPVGRMNGHEQQSSQFATLEVCVTGRRRRSREVYASNLQQLEQLEVDQVLANYDKNKLRNVRRKELKKKKKAMLALEKANLSAKSSGSQSQKKRRSTERGIEIETERGFRMRKDAISLVSYKQYDRL